MLVTRSKFANYIRCEGKAKEVEEREREMIDVTITKILDK